YKSDIEFIKEEENTHEIISAAFGFIYFSDYGYMQNAFIALQNNVPLIVDDDKTNNSIFNKAALFSKKSIKAISEKMQLLYKNENQRNYLQNEGKVLLKKYSTNNAANTLYNTLVQQLDLKKAEK
ncbi:MAG: hypothetical protein ABL929_05390, partial [Ferruginibacter sp.]